MATATANGKKFTFPEGTTPEQMGVAIDEYFAGQTQQPEQAQPEQEKGMLQTASDFVTGNDRETVMSQGAPELEESKLQLLSAGLDPETPLSELLANPKKREELQKAHKSKLMSGDFSGFFKDALGQFVTPLTTGDKETSAISRGRFENLQETTDEKGNVYLVNPDSGYSMVINKPGISARDVVNLGANAAAFATGPAAGTVARAIGKDALIQSGIEGAQQQAGGEFNLEDIAMAGASSGVLKGAENALGTGFRLAKGEVSDDAAQAIGDIESRGLTARTQDVLPPETLPGKMAASTGELNPLTSGQQAAQQKAREQASQSYVDQFTPSYDEIKKSVSDTLGAKFAKSIDDRQFALDKAQEAPLVVDKTLDAIDREIARLTKSKSGAPLATADNASVKVLEDYKQDVINAQSIDELADLRTNFRDDFSAALGEAKSSRKEGAKKYIYGAMTKDMDETIRPAVTPQEFAKYKKGNEVYGQTVEEVKKGRIKSILQGGEDLSPEQIDRALFSKDSVNRAKLYKSLDDNGIKNAQGAMITKLWNESKGINQFLTRLENNEAALKTFFKGESAKELEGLKRALSATRSAQDAAANPPTGQRLAPLLLGGGLVADLGSTIAGTLASAGAYKAYQSKPVRNALLKLANTPKGSSRFERAMSDLNRALVAATQTANDTERTQ